MLVRLGDPIEVGQPVARIFGRHETAPACRSLVASSITIVADRPAPSPLIAERLLGVGLVHSV